MRGYGRFGKQEVVGLRGRGHEKESKLTMCDVDMHRVGTHDELSLRCLIELGDASN